MELVARLNFMSWNFHFNNWTVMKGGIFILLLLILISCSNRNDSNITSLLKEWEQKEILFPKKIYFTTMLKDTIYYNLNSEYKILTYVDSIGCTSCKLQLPAWDILIKEIDSLYVDKVNFVFVFSPHRIKEIHHAILTSNFNYPVCVDDLDSITKLNNFPSDSRFHTFLLDRNNKVMAIGNPIQNPRIKELYWNIISGRLDSSLLDNQPLTTVSLSSSQIEMGNFSWEKEQEVEFEICNTGEIPLVINDVITSCGCVTAKYVKKPFNPHEIAKMKIIYKSERPERFDKTITVYCNASNAPLRVEVTGNAH